MQKFSVCMAVYGGDQAEDFKKAVFSIYEQTVRPDEIIIVVDGPVPDPVAKVIADLESAIDIIRVIWSAENQGHAVARETGLLAAKHELVAIMDSDDLSLPDRFEKQLKVFERHPEVSVVGGLVSEFVSSTGAIAGVRAVPQYNYAIKKSAFTYLSDHSPVMLVLHRRKHQSIAPCIGRIGFHRLKKKLYSVLIMCTVNNHPCLKGIHPAQPSGIRNSRSDMFVGNSKYMRANGCQ